MAAARSRSRVLLPAVAPAGRPLRAARARRRRRARLGVRGRARRGWRWSLLAVGLAAATTTRGRAGRVRRARRAADRQRVLRTRRAGRWSARRSMGALLRAGVATGRRSASCPATPSRSGSSPARSAGSTCWLLGRPNGGGTRMTRLRGRRASTLAYDKRVVAEGLDVEIPDGGFTAIVGPNACGKSTLLRALARMLKPRAGRGAARRRRRSRRSRRKEVARAARPAAAVRGRAGRDHGRRPRRPRPPPAPAAAAAVVARRTSAAVARRDGRDRASPTSPTARRRAVRRPAPARLARDGARPGDAAAAARRADDVPRPRRTRSRCSTCAPSCTSSGPHARRGAARPQPRLPLRHPPDRDARGRVVAQGAPAEVVDAELVEDVFGLRCRVIDDPETGTPLIVPSAPAARSPASRPRA